MRVKLRGGEEDQAEWERGMGGASGGGNRGGEEAQALSPRPGVAGEAGPAGTTSVATLVVEQCEGGDDRGGVGWPAGVGRPRWV